MITDWKKKDLWTRRSNKFCVEVSRHAVAQSSIDPYEGTNRWAVYAYIYPEHRSFSRFNGDSMFQEAACCMPLHGGPSYLRIHRNESGEKITCYQVGADYHHLHDDSFTYCENESDAASVFFDADELFKWLSDDEVSE